MRGGKWNPASLSKVCLLRCHYTTNLDTSASATTAFLFSLTVIGGKESHTEHLGKLILQEKTIAWLVLSEGAEQAQSWQPLDSAFALKSAAASVSGCLVVRKEKDDAGDRLSHLGAPGLPGALKVLAFNLFSLKLRKCCKSCLKNAHLEE